MPPTNKSGLIISVDDFGFTEAVNESVIILAEKGVISATNVMVNMPYADAIQSVAAMYPNLSIGLHLTLTQGRPLSPPESVPTLVDSDGSFWDRAAFARRAFRGQISRKDCRREIEAQIQVLKRLVGDRVDHWNSHQGAHRFEPGYMVCLALFRKYDVRGLRTHRHYFVTHIAPLQIQHPGWRDLAEFGLRRVLVETYYNWLAWRAARHFELPDGTLDYPGQKVVDLLELVAEQKLPAGIWEIACHTATSQAGLWGTGLLQERVDEYNALSSSQFQAAVTDQRVALLNFSQL